MLKPHVLIARPDSAGDVLLAGPAVRAVAAGARRVTLLAGPRGAAAARLLPGVDEVLVRHIPWIDAEPERVSPEAMLEIADAVSARQVDEALIITSFHQSALPTALLLRLAGVRRIAAISQDYPGSLLDVRLPSPGDVHEAERALFVASGLGFSLPADDDGRLEVMRSGLLAPALVDAEPYVVVHPGASVPARAWSAAKHTELVQALRSEGWTIAVTGGPDERALTAEVAGPPGSRVHDLGGQTDLSGLAETLAGATAVVTGNTGPAHLSAAVGTPVVSLFAPTVPAVRWRPWRVAHELLYVEVACAGCRAKTCPVPGHPCLEGVTVKTVVKAVSRITQTSSQPVGASA